MLGIQIRGLVPPFLILDTPAGPPPFFKKASAYLGLQEWEGTTLAAALLLRTEWLGEPERTLTQVIPDLVWG